MARNANRQPGQRALRIGEELRHALARVFERGELRDPDLAGIALTVTEIRVSPDLKSATAFVMPLGGANAAPVLTALRRSAPYLRRVLALAVTLRYAPAIAFELDTAFDHARQIDALLRKPEIERDLGAQDGSDDEDDENA